MLSAGFDQPLKDNSEHLEYIWTDRIRQKEGTGNDKLEIVREPYANITVLCSKQEALPEEILYYEDELSEMEGYRELSDEQKRRIETLKGDFQIGEMAIRTSGFSDEWYETQNDTLIKQEIVFKNINEVYFGGERYQVVDGIYAYDNRMLSGTYETGYIDNWLSGAESKNMGIDDSDRQSIEKSKVKFTDLRSAEFAENNYEAVEIFLYDRTRYQKLANSLEMVYKRQ